MHPVHTYLAYICVFRVYSGGDEYMHVPISFRWSLCLSSFGLYVQYYFTTGGPFDLFSCTKRHRVLPRVTPRPKKNASEGENLVPGTMFIFSAVHKYLVRGLLLQNLRSKGASLP